LDSGIIKLLCFVKLLYTNFAKGKAVEVARLLARFYIHVFRRGVESQNTEIDARLPINLIAHLRQRRELAGPCAFVIVADTPTPSALTCEFGGSSQLFNLEKIIKDQLMSIL
jgi:hypothetical protein